MKINKECSSTFPTRLVSKGGVYSSNQGSKEENAMLLEKSGFIKHENCIPFLSKMRGSQTNKADAELRKIETLDVNILSCGKDRKKQMTSLKTSLQEEGKKMEEIRKPFLLDLERKQKELKRIEECKDMFGGLETVPLRDLKQGK